MTAPSGAVLGTPREGLGLIKKISSVLEIATDLAKVIPVQIECQPSKCQPFSFVRYSLRPYPLVAS